MRLEDREVYSLTSRLTHWATAALMAVAFSLVWLREDLPNQDLRSVMLELHQWAGSAGADIAAA